MPTQTQLAFYSVTVKKLNYKQQEGDMVHTHATYRVSPALTACVLTSPMPSNRDGRLCTQNSLCGCWAHAMGLMTKSSSVKFSCQR